MASPLRSGYSVSQVALHWAVALLVLFQLVFGDSMSQFLDLRHRGTTIDASVRSWADYHYWVGLTILALILLRLLLRLARSVPEPAETGPGWMKKAAAASHALFYVILLAMPVLGLLGYYIGDPYADIHSWGKPLLIILICIHAAAALLHHFWLKDGTLRRMLVPAR
ncbi:MAG: cytochrome b [Rhizobiaceae bacterium]|nr:MAG: cytochrome b [Rhizobiaceae bacterium]